MKRQRFIDPQILKDLQQPDIVKIIASIRKVLEPIDTEIEEAPDYRPAMFLLEYLANNDNELKATINLRKDLLRSYERANDGWRIDTKDDKAISDEELETISNQFEGIIQQISILPTDIESFGQVLLRSEITNGGDVNAMPTKIKCEVIPQTEFQRDYEKEVQIYDAEGELRTIKVLGRDEDITVTDAEAYIYMQDAKLTGGGNLKSLAILSAIRMNNLIQWANYNQKAQGLIGVQFDAVELNKQIKEYLRKTKVSVDDDIEYQQKKKTLEDMIDSVKKIGQDITVAYPAGLNVEGKSVVSGSFDTYRSLDNAIVQTYEKEYFGQSSTTASTVSGNYGTGAGLKSLRENTVNKERSDRIALIQIANKILEHYWIVWKGNNEDTVCPLRFMLGSESNEDIKLNLQIIQANSSLSMDRPLQMTEATYYQKIGFPLPPDVDGNAIRNIGGNRNMNMGNMESIDEL